MFSNVKNMFKIPDLRGKIFFTLAVIALYRFGSHVPTPGVSFEAVEALSEQSQRGGVLGFLNLFSGGALTRFAVFGLGMPLAPLKLQTGDKLQFWIEARDNRQPSANVSISDAAMPVMSEATSGV